MRSTQTDNSHKSTSTLNRFSLSSRIMWHWLRVCVRCLRLCRHVSEQCPIWECSVLGVPLISIGMCTCVWLRFAACDAQFAANFQTHVNKDCWKRSLAANWTFASTGVSCQYVYKARVNFFVYLSMLLPWILSLHCIEVVKIKSLNYIKNLFFIYANFMVIEVLNC